MYSVVLVQPQPLRPNRVLTPPIPENDEFLSTPEQSAKGDDIREEFRAMFERCIQLTEQSAESARIASEAATSVARATKTSSSAAAKSATNKPYDEFGLVDSFDSLPAIINAPFDDTPDCNDDVGAVGGAVVDGVKKGRGRPKGGN